jgi:hypothetical protein
MPSRVWFTSICFFVFFLGHTLSHGISPFVCVPVIPVCVVLSFNPCKILLDFPCLFGFSPLTRAALLACHHCFLAFLCLFRHLPLKVPLSFSLASLLSQTCLVSRLFPSLGPSVSTQCTLLPHSLPFWWPITISESYFDETLCVHLRSLLSMLAPSLIQRSPLLSLRVWMAYIPRHLGVFF